MNAEVYHEMTSWWQDTPDNRIEGLELVSKTGDVRSIKVGAAIVERVGLEKISGKQDSKEQQMLVEYVRVCC